MAPALAVQPQPPLLAGSRWGQQRCPSGMDPGLPATSNPSAFLLSPSFPGQGQRPSYLLAGEVGKEGGVASVQVPGHDPSAFPGKGPGFTVPGQRSREAGAPSQQAFMRHPVARRSSPRSLAAILPLPLPPRSAPQGCTRSHTSFHLCPGARQPLAHPWMAPQLPCPPRLPPPHPPHR